MVEENMVNTLLQKVGLPTHGTLGEKVERLRRMGHWKEPVEVAKKPQEINKLAVNKAEVVLEDIKEPTVTKVLSEYVDTEVQPAKRGRPKKGK